MSLEALEAAILEHWSKLVPESHYTFLRERGDDGRVHVEFTDGAYHFIGTDRGTDTYHSGPLSFEQAIPYELFNLCKGRAYMDYLKTLKTKDRSAAQRGYSRWDWFAMTIDNMDVLSPDFGRYARDQIQRILDGAPLSQDELSNATRSIPARYMPA